MASTTDDKPGAGGAPEPDGDMPHAIFNLPAPIDADPASSAPDERSAGGPDPAYERIALTLWESGRKEEAVEFLSREVQRRKAAALRDWPILDVAPEPARLAPPHRISRRPFYLGAGLALSALVLWLGVDRIAAVPGWLNEEEAAVEAVAAAGEPQAEEQAAKAAGAEDTAGEAPIQTGSIARTGEAAGAGGQDEDSATAMTDETRVPRARPDPPAVVAGIDPRHRDEPSMMGRHAPRSAWERAEQQHRLAERRALAERQAAIRRYQRWARSHFEEWRGQNRRGGYYDGPYYDEGPYYGGPYYDDGWEYY